MKIFPKLVIAFLSMAVLMGYMGYLSVGRLKAIRYHVAQLGRSSVIEFEAADRMQAVLESCHLSVLRLGLPLHGGTSFSRDTPDRGDPVRNIRAGLEEFSGLLATSINATETAVDLALRYDDGEMAASERDELETWLYPLQDLFQDYKALLLNTIRPAGEEPSVDGRNTAAQTEARMFMRMRTLIDAIREDAREEMHADIAEIIVDYIPNATRIVVGATLLCFLLAIVLGYGIARGISRPIQVLESASVRVGKGRLDIPVEIKSGNELGVLGRAFNRMMLDLRQTTISKEFLDSVIESMTDALVVTTPDLTVKVVNEAACQLTGYGRAELAGRPVRRLFGPGESAAALFDGLQAGSAVRNVELSCRTRQGDSIPILFSARALVKEGRVDAVVCAARDIRERKASEIALRKAHDEMEKRVADRTRELADTAERLHRELLGHRATDKALRLSEERLRRLSYSVLMAQEDERKRLAHELHDMLRTRRESGNLSREEFFFVSMMSWFHLTLEFNSPLVIALRAEASSEDQRLFKVAERVKLPAHGKTFDFFRLADPMSSVLIQIELGTFNDEVSVPALYTPGSSLEADMRRIITHWSIATGRDMKATRVKASG